MNERYKRHIKLIGGESAQEKLSKAVVAVIGAGGIGNIAAKFLASAGVGCLEIWDNDKVELSNLNRQVMFSENTIGIPKSVALCRTIGKVNSETICDPIVDKFKKPYNLECVDIVLDCTDNLESSYYIEEQALKEKIPVAFAKTSNFSGVVKLIKDKPFLKLNYPTEQLNKEHDVFPTLGAIIGGIQAGLVIKYLTGLKYDEDLLYYDALNNITKRVIL